MWTIPVACGYNYILIRQVNDKGVLPGFPGLYVLFNGLGYFGGLSTPGRIVIAILFPLLKTVEYPAKSAICGLYTSRFDQDVNGSGNGIAAFAGWTEKGCNIHHHVLSVARLDAHPAEDSSTVVVHIGIEKTVWEIDRQASVDRVLCAHS